MEQPGYEQRGYLREDFRLFHLSAAMTEPVGWHYHAFHKLCVYLGGDAIRYGIEGRSYALEPGGQAGQTIRRCTLRLRR